MPVAADLFTTIQNTSDGTHPFSFLGPHGKRLAPGATVTLPGDYVAKLGAQRSPRAFNALHKALQAGQLAILARPVPLLFDTTSEEPKLLLLDDGDLGLADPVYEADE